MDNPTIPPAIAVSTVDSSTTQMQTDQPGEPQPSDATTQMSGLNMEDNLIQEILNAVLHFNSELVRQHVQKLVPNPSEHLTDSVERLFTMAPNQACNILNQNVLHYVVVASPPTSMPSSKLQMARLQIVTALLANFSQESKTKIMKKTDNQGRTPLHVAAATDSPHLIRHLLDHGACAYSTDNTGQTPLHMAAVNLAKNTAQVLIDGLERAAVRPSLAEREHMLYETYLRAPLDLLRMPDAFHPGSVKNYSNMETKPIADLLKEHQDKEQGFEHLRASPQFTSSSAFWSSVHLLHYEKRKEGKFDVTKTFTTFHKPVTEVLHGTSPWLGALRSRMDFALSAGVQEANSGVHMSGWIHLRANNVRETTLNLRFPCALVSPSPSPACSLRLVILEVF